LIIYTLQILNQFEDTPQILIIDGPYSDKTGEFPQGEVSHMIHSQGQVTSMARAKLYYRGGRETRRQQNLLAKHEPRPRVIDPRYTQILAYIPQFPLNILTCQYTLGDLIH
jgi:hypothetical protein